jgi:putative chitobiose transport system substrate-binding protein
MQLKPEFTEYVTGVIDTFEADNPDNPVRWEDVPWNAMETKILTAVSAQTAPDVVNLNPKFASQLATRNAWLDLNEAVTPDDRGAYLPKIWEAGTLGGESFGVPWYLTTQITVYNQELLAAADIDEPPATYAELATVAEAVKEKTGKYAFFVTFVPEDSGEVLESFVKMGVTLVDEAGQAAFDTPAGRAAFQYWVDLYERELLPPEVLTQGHRYAIDLYQAGETAVVATSAQFLGAIETNAPAVAAVSAAAPQITGDTGKKNVAVMNLVIPRNSDRPEAAVQFALFVTNSENQLSFAQAANVLPSTQEALQQYIAFLKGKPDPTPVEVAVTVGAEQLADAEVLIPPMEKLNLLQKAIYENLQGAMLGQKTVEAAVQDAAAQFNAG